MSDVPLTQPPGWYHAQGDPPGTQRYWDGSSWQGGPQPVPGVAAPVGDKVDQVLAEPVKRILARLIDGGIWIVIWLVLPALIETGVVLSLLLGFFTGALVVVYEVVMIGTTGATVGKQLLGLKVVNQDGSAADYMTGLRRMGLYILFLFVGLIPILGALAFVAVAIAGVVMLFTDSQRQTPWDKIGQTLVMEA